MSPSMHFGEFIEHHNWSFRRAGEHFDLSAMTAWRYAHGYVVPAPDTMERIYRLSGGEVGPESWYTFGRFVAL